MGILWSVVLTGGFLSEPYTHFGLVCLLAAIFGSIAGIGEAFGDFPKPRPATIRYKQEDIYPES
jgi:hypothetical protein